MRLRLRPPSQFTIMGVLLATLWIAICCAAWRVDGIKTYGDAGYLASISFRYVSVPAAIGALFGRTLIGLAVGVALYLLLLACVFFALAHFGP